MDDGTAKRGWTRWLLIGSLALNLLIIGALAGAAFKFAGGGKSDYRRAAEGGGGLPALVRALPRAERDALRQDFGAKRRDLREKSGHRAGALRARVADALEAEPFDIEAIAAILGAERRAMSTLAENGGQLYLDAVAAMDPEARRAYAERLRKKRKGARD